MSLFARRPEAASVAARDVEQVDALRELLSKIRATCAEVVVRSDVRSPVAAALQELLENGVLSLEAERRALDNGRSPRG